MPEALDDKDKDALHKERARLEELVTRPGSSSSVPADISDDEVVDVLAQYVPIEPIERQGLLELDSVLLRARKLIELLESTRKRAGTLPGNPERALASGDPL